MEPGWTDASRQQAPILPLRLPLIDVRRGLDTRTRDAADHRPCSCHLERIVSLKMAGEGQTPFEVYRDACISVYHLIISMLPSNHPGPGHRDRWTPCGALSLQDEVGLVIILLGTLGTSRQANRAPFLHGTACCAGTSLHKLICVLVSFECRRDFDYDQINVVLPLSLFLHRVHESCVLRS